MKKMYKIKASVCLAMRRTYVAFTHASARARPRASRSPLGRQLHPIYLTCPCTRNGALLHTHQPRVCTFGRTRLYPPSNHPIVAFSRANDCEIERFPRFFLFRRARLSSFRLLFRGIADALEPHRVPPQSRLWNFARACRSTRSSSEEHQFRVAANCICLASAADLLFLIARERQISLCLTINNI